MLRADGWVLRAVAAVIVVESPEKMELVENDFLARLRTYVRRRVPSSGDADDVVQTVLLRLIEAKAVGAVSSAHAWLRATARSAIADFHRARARTAQPLEFAEDVADHVAEEQSDITNCLKPLLSALDPDDRAILERVDVRGESQAALARELSLSSSGVKSRVQRARSRLRESVLARCIVERDAEGMPVGPATCRPSSGRPDCPCS